MTTTLTLGVAHQTIHLSHTEFRKKEVKKFEKPNFAYVSLSSFMYFDYLRLIQFLHFKFIMRIKSKVRMESRGRGEKVAQCLKTRC